jgi:hypothetical protein
LGEWETRRAVGFLDFPDPVGWFEEVKDEGQKRALVSLATSLAYSQYITGLYTLGKSLQGKPIVGILSSTFVAMAAATYKMLLLQDSQKLIYTAVPAALANDKQLLDSIHYEKEQHK